MITKILTIKISKEDKTTKTVDDVLKVYRGPDTESIIIEAPVTSRQVVDKKDLYDAITAIEEFYGEVPKKSSLPEIVVSKAVPENSALFTNGEMSGTVVLSNLGTDKELEAAQKDTYFVVEHGDDNS